MKYLWFIFILCLVPSNSDDGLDNLFEEFLNKISEGLARRNHVLTECARKYNLELDKRLMLIVKKKQDFSDWAATDEQACFISCTTRALVNETDNFYEYIKYQVDMIDATGYEHERDEMLEKLNKCNEKVGNDECKLFQCLEFQKTPFLKFVELKKRSTWILKDIQDFKFTKKNLFNSPSFNDDAYFV